MSAQRCPQCGTVRGADGSHGCACAERAAEAVRAERTAQIAAAEDFDPLRIRPYVTLPEPAAGPEPHAPRLLGVVQPVVQPPSEPWEAGDPAETMRLFSEPVAAAAVVGGDGRPGRRRRRSLVPSVAVGVAAVAAIGVSAFAVGVFSDRPDVELSMPDTRTSAPVVPSQPDGSPSAPGSPSSSVSASASARESASPSPSASASAPASPTPSASTSAPKPATESASRPTASQSTPEEPAQSRVAGPPVLSYGDEGAEVVELQRRLAQFQLYDGPDNGRYGRRVENGVAEFQMYAGVEEDPEGVYGPETRSALESLTHEP